MHHASIKHPESCIKNNYQSFNSILSTERTPSVLRIPLDCTLCTSAAEDARSTSTGSSSNSSVEPPSDLSTSSQSSSLFSSVVVVMLCPRSSELNFCFLASGWPSRLGSMVGGSGSLAARISGDGENSPSSALDWVLESCSVGGKSLLQGFNLVRLYITEEGL